MSNLDVKYLSVSVFDGSVEKLECVIYPCLSMHVNDDYLSLTPLPLTTLLALFQLARRAGGLVWFVCYNILDQ